jgi:tetratricopeptide (TPR) repeat protein
VRYLLLSLAIFFGCASGPEPAPPQKPDDETLPASVPSSRKSGALEAAKKRAREGDLAGAISASKEAIAEDPRSEEAHLLLSSLHEMGGDRLAAEKALRGGIEKLPGSAELHHALGMNLLEGGDSAMAVAELEKAKELGGGNQKAELLADLAYAYLFTNKLEDAERLAGEARKLDPKGYAAAFTHGEALLRLERWREAAEAYRVAIQASPDESLPKARLATALIKTGDFQGALEPLEQLLKTEKDDPARIHAAIAHAKLQLGLPKEAVAHAKSAVELAPKIEAYKKLLSEAQAAAGEKPGKAPRASGKKGKR